MSVPNALSPVADILNSVTTPLALAGLALLVCYFSVSFFANKNLIPRNAASGILKYALTIGLILSLSANASYVFGQYLGSEYIFRGLVIDENNNPVDRARVRLAGVGSAMTADSGEFFLSIPASRALDRYDFFVGAVGYSPHSAVILSKRPATTTVSLKKIQPSPANLTKFGDGMTAGNYLGIPFVGIPIDFHNTTSEIVTIRDLSFSIDGPDEDKIQKIVSIQIPGGPLQPSLPFYTLKPGDSISFIHFFGEDQSTFLSLQGSLSQSMPSEIDFSCRQLGRMPPDAMNVHSQFFDDNFYWMPGDYSGRLAYQINGKSASHTLKFSISTKESSDLKNAKSLIARCQGLMWGSHFISTSNAKTFVSKALSETPVN